MDLNHLQAYSIDSICLLGGSLDLPQTCLVGSTFSSSFENDTLVIHVPEVSHVKIPYPFLRVNFGSLASPHLWAVWNKGWISVPQMTFYQLLLLCHPLISTFKPVISSYILDNSRKIKLHMAFLSSTLRFNFLGFTKAFSTSLSTLHFLMFCYFSSQIFIFLHLCIKKNLSLSFNGVLEKTKSR